MNSVLFVPHSKKNSEIVNKEKSVPHSVVGNSRTDEISHNEDREREFSESRNDTRKSVSIKHDLLVLIDSNGKEIITGKLYPGYSIKKIPCMTLENSTVINDSCSFKKEPNVILIHFGTNDLEHKDKNEVPNDASWWRLSMF